MNETDESDLIDAIAMVATELELQRQTLDVMCTLLARAERQRDRTLGALARICVLTQTDPEAVVRAGMTT